MLADLGGNGGVFSCAKQYSQDNACINVLDYHDKRDLFEIRAVNYTHYRDYDKWNPIEE